MQVYERMIRFEYYWYVIRCWVPVENPREMDISDFVLAYCYRDFLYDIKVVGSDYFSIAKLLSEKFNLNACEVTNKETGMGGLYYMEWP